MSTAFDFYGEHLFEQAKYMFEQAKSTKEDEKRKQAFLNSSLLLAFSSLEAYINSISDEVVNFEGFGLTLYEKSILKENEISVEKGKVQLKDTLKMSRLIDRIELIYCKFSHKEILPSDSWNYTIKQTIKWRNDLVHPKDDNDCTENQVEIALQSVLDTVNVLFKAVYGNEVPILRLGLQSVL